MPRTKRDPELQTAIDCLIDWYDKAKNANEAKPGFIESPIAWAMYHAYQEVETRRRIGKWKQPN